MKKSIIFVLLVLFIPSFLIAQEKELKPKKFKGAEWYWIIYTDFEVGKFEEAHKIMKKYWAPINNKLGTEQEVYTSYSGTWNMVRVVKMKDGISQLDWEVSPFNIEFNKELLRLAGSEDEVKKIREQWNACVDDSKVEIVRKMKRE